jgi:hypothetical protein
MTAITFEDPQTGKTFTDVFPDHEAPVEMQKAKAAGWVVLERCWSNYATGNLGGTPE